MRLQLLSSIFLAVSVYGFPSMLDGQQNMDGEIKVPKKIDWSKHQYKKPGPNDLRSPCPGLNTLANHGILPRDGRGLTVRSILDAGLDGYNVQNDVLGIAAKVGQTTTQEIDTYTLADIRMHNSIEHDASVSRGDLALGDNFSFNETIYQVLANSNPGVDYYNATSAGQVQKQRLIDAAAINPDIINTVKEFLIRTRESALYLVVMGGGASETGNAPKKFVDIFFREERLPLEEGWKRAETPITGDSMNNMSVIIAQASEWTPDVSKCPSIDFIIWGNDTLHV